ncbi:hypothetical protein C5167_032990 [Papaver somniferum]|uniref:NADP-dependent oxidoreductase domain-containing protein n=1 Tax=Papaver somniferum TaxID=3469 RepID=A0A4Y7KCD8_PAPSO|nr:hypothetical protein C5167_032990 [Papaver somniferum]
MGGPDTVVSYFCRIFYQVKMGPLTVSPMGFGTWAWGNQLLWGYQEAMDDDLQATFNLAVENGINLFDTADSYGTGRLNGQRKASRQIPPRVQRSIFLNLVISTLTEIVD